MSATRKLSEDERTYIATARDKAFRLYEGVQVAHRSCGIALAETFRLPHAPYQALRRGGITGEGRCGAITAGELVLGQLLGDPDPAGRVTQELANAISWYQQVISTRIDKGAATTTICNDLTRQFGDFSGAARKSFCTNIAAQVAETVAEALVRFDSETTRPATDSVSEGTTC